MPFTLTTQAALVVTHAESEWGVDLYLKELERLVEFAASRKWQIVFITSGGKWGVGITNPYKGTAESSQLFSTFFADGGACCPEDLEVKTRHLILAGGLWTGCLKVSTAGLIHQYFQQAGGKKKSLTLHVPISTAATAETRLLRTEYLNEWSIAATKSKWLQKGLIDQEEFKKPLPRAVRGRILAHLRSYPSRLFTTGISKEEAAKMKKNAILKLESPQDYVFSVWIGKVPIGRIWNSQGQWTFKGNPSGTRRIRLQLYENVQSLKSQIFPNWSDLLKDFKKKNK